MFDSIDKDGSGELEGAELEQLAEWVLSNFNPGKTITTQQKKDMAEKLLKRCDTDGDGKVDRTEFYNYYEKSIIEQEKFKSKKKIQKAPKPFGQPVTGKETDHDVQMIDALFVKHKPKEDRTEEVWQLQAALESRAGLVNMVKKQIHDLEADLQRHKDIQEGKVRPEDTESHLLGHYSSDTDLEQITETEDMLKKLKAELKISEAITKQEAKQLNEVLQESFDGEMPSRTFRNRDSVPAASSRFLSDDTTNRLIHQGGRIHRTGHGFQQWEGMIQDKNLLDMKLIDDGRTMQQIIEVRTEPYEPNVDFLERVHRKVPLFHGNLYEKATSPAPSKPLKKSLFDTGPRGTDNPGHLRRASRFDQAVVESDLMFSVQQKQGLASTAIDPLAAEKSANEVRNNGHTARSERGVRMALLNESLFETKTNIGVQSFGREPGSTQLDRLAVSMPLDTMDAERKVELLAKLPSHTLQAMYRPERHTGGSHVVTIGGSELRTGGSYQVNKASRFIP